MKFEHIPVMRQEVREHQNLKPGDICADCTLGGAGHALETVRAILPDGMLIGIDQDMDAIRNAEKILSPFKKNVLLFHQNFSDLPEILDSKGIRGVNSILLDLGFSLNQIKNSRRGFSFSREDPLDMRMNTQTTLTAEKIINSWKEKELADIFFKFGEEKFSRKAARAIVKERREKPVKTGLELGNIIKKVIHPQKKYRIHPATRIFQALRIAVNRELEHLENLMKAAPSLLLKQGRLCVISFNSLEDRIVKQSIKKYEKVCTCPKELPKCSCDHVPLMESVFRKPLVPSGKEIDLNPMARSSKLRIARKL